MTEPPPAQFTRAKARLRDEQGVQTAAGVIDVAAQLGSRTMDMSTGTAAPRSDALPESKVAERTASGRIVLGLSISFRHCAVSTVGLPEQCAQSRTR